MAVLHDLLYLRSIQSFKLQECLGESVHFRAIFREEIPCALVGVIDEQLDFGIDLAGGIFAETTGPGHVARQKDVLVIVPVGNHPEVFAHAPFTNHLAGNDGGLADIAGGPAGDIAEGHFLCDTATHDNHKFIQKFVFAGVVFVFLRQPHSGTEGRPTGYDGYFMEGFGVFADFQKNGVAGLVNGGGFLFLFGNRHAAALFAPADFVAGFFEVLGGDGFGSAAGGHQSGFIDHIGQLGTRIAGGATGDDVQIHVSRHFDFFSMDLEDSLAALHIGKRDGNLTVKTTRTQQCRVQDVRTVGSGDDDDPFTGVKTIHLHEESVQGLFPFIMSAAHAMTSVTADSVDFVNENQTRSALAALFKHIAHAAGTYAHEHFHKIRSTDAEKGHVCFARDGLGNEGFACAGRAGHEDTFGDVAAQLLEFLGILEKLHQLGNLLLGFIHPSHLFEGDFIFVHREQFGPAFAKTHCSATRHFDLLTEEKINQPQKEK